MKKEKLQAVALKYPEDADAPFIVAKSKGVLAEKLLKIAEDNKIPIVKNDFVSNVLTTQEIGSYIPQETWGIIAKIFTIIIDNNKKM